MYSSNDYLFEHGSIEGDTSDAKRYGVNSSFCLSNRVKIGLRVILLGLPYLLIIVLFSLVSTSKKTTNNYMLPSFTGSISAPSTSVPSAVSFSSTGSIRVGAGTSIYKDVVSILENSPQYVSMAAVYESVYLVASNEVKSNQSTLSVIVVNPSNPSEGTVKFSVVVPYAIASVESLNAASGVFVALSQDESTAYNSSLVRVGQVDASSYVITFGAGVEYAPKMQYEVGSQLARLSDTSFALSYYLGSAVFTAVGTVQSGSLSLLLSDPRPFVSNVDQSVYATVVGLSSTVYLLIHYDSSLGFIERGVYTGPMNVTVATVAPIAQGSATNAVVTVGSSIVLAESWLIGYMFGTQLDEFTAVVAYSNLLTQGGVTAVLIKLIATETGYSVLFGSSLDITNGETVSLTSKGYMDLDIATLSGSNQVLVLYSDLANGGAVSAVQVQITSTAELQINSPYFVVTANNPNSNQNIYWGALACGTLHADFIQVAVLDVLTNLQSSAEIHVSMMQVLPRPAGLVPGSSSFSSSDSSVGRSDAITAGVRGEPMSATSQSLVVFGGVIEGFSGLMPGMVYVTNSQGRIVCSGLYFGSESRNAYVTSSDSLISLDAQKRFSDIIEPACRYNFCCMIRSSMFPKSSTTSFSSWMEEQKALEEGREVTGNTSEEAYFSFAGISNQFSSLQDNLSAQLQDLTGQIPEVGPLSAAFRARVTNAVYLILAAFVFTVLAIFVGLPTLLLRPSKFIVLISLATLCAASSVIVIQKPSVFLANLLQGGLSGALPVVLLLSSVLFTLYVTVFIHRFFVVIFAGALQMLVILYFLSTFIPGGTRGLEMLLRTALMLVRSAVGPCLFVCRKSISTTCSCVGGAISSRLFT